MRLIGIHARLHAGKDTAFETIRQEAEDNAELAVRRAFADPLKISGMRALGFNDSHEELVALANMIKETGRVTVTWDEHSTNGNIIPKACVITGRQFWQLYGTEAHRVEDLGASFSPAFWVDNLLPLGEKDAPGVRVWHEAEAGFVTEKPQAFWDNFTESWAGYADYAVVTDVRFPNEAERILELGGEVWWLDAEQRLGPNEDGHASEQKLDDEFITTTVDNNGTLEEFEANIRSALADD